MNTLRSVAAVHERIGAPAFWGVLAGGEAVAVARGGWAGWLDVDLEWVR